VDPHAFPDLGDHAIEADRLWAFAAFAFVASATPGPNNVILTATGGAVGLLRGLPALFGVAIGFALMIFSITAGLGGIVLDHPQVLAVLRWVGIAIILRLSWHIAAAPVGVADDGRRRPAGFRRMVVFQWVNPKAWMITASAIADYLGSESGSRAQGLTFALIFVVAALIGSLPWLVLGATAARFMTNATAQRAFNVAMGTLLAGSVLLLV